MDSEKLKKRKYPSALKLAQGERETLPKMYDGGMKIKDIANHFSTTSATVIKALVFLGYDGPKWAVDAVQRTVDNNKIKPSNMKRTKDPLI